MRGHYTKLSSVLSSMIYQILKIPSNTNISYLYVVLYYLGIQLLTKICTEYTFSLGFKIYYHMMYSCYTYMGLYILCVLIQRFSTCGTWKAHIWRAKKMSLYKKKMESIIVHKKYYFDINNKKNNNCKYLLLFFLLNDDIVIVL